MRVFGIYRAKTTQTIQQEKTCKLIGNERDELNCLQQCMTLQLNAVSRGDLFRSQKLLVRFYRE